MDVFQKPSEPPEFSQNCEVCFGGYTLTKKPVPNKCRDGKTANSKFV
jgi:hypothetical protein